jgi:dephospho-CoA kinase
MRFLIGITGHMGSGKSTVAQYLTAKYGFQRMRISGKMREIAKELELEPSRDFLQGISEFMKVFDEDVWIKYVAKRVETSTSSIVIDDIRVKNEIDLLRPLGFQFLRVESPSLNRKKRIESRRSIKISELDWKKWSTHSTEIQVPHLSVDFIIKNEKSIRDLEDQVDRIMLTLGFSL